MSARPLNLCAVVFVSALVSPLGLRMADAVPILQLYLEGADYNSETESWELSPPGSSAGEPFRLWAIGNVGGPGGKGTISNVRLSAAFSQEALDAGLEISAMKGSTIGGFGGFVDTSEPDDPSLDGDLVTDGSSPILGDGTSLPAHGIFGAGTVWQEFALGDFTLKDSPVADFIGEFPTSFDTTTVGQINVYEISVLNGSGFTVHFDLYDTIVSKNDAKFAPFSHDVDADANIVPEPSSLVVWSLFCALGIAVQRWRRRKVS